MLFSRTNSKKSVRAYEKNGRKKKKVYAASDSLRHTKSTFATILPNWASFVLLFSLIIINDFTVKNLLPDFLRRRMHDIKKTNGTRK